MFVPSSEFIVLEMSVGNAARPMVSASLVYSHLKNHQFPGNEPTATE